MQIDDRQFSTDELLKLWINGEYFHNPLDKRRLLAELDPLHREIIRGLFVWAVFAATHYIIVMANVIKNALDNGLVTE